MTRLERFTWFVGEVARPFAIIWISLACGIAIIRLATAAVDLSEAAVYAAAILAGLAALYASKSAEESSKAKSAAKVEIAKSDTPSPEKE